ncbi:MAG: UDP-glucose--hexose-1-phosphate uridylyltransferase [Clostridia bacterium]|nr:UDP-glucose--hexose-1-phosphate uridylyltransferase [Clostridia bacterium]
MSWETRSTIAIERLLSFAQEYHLTESEDRAYYRNLLLDLMHMDAPDMDHPCEEIADGEKPGETATEILTSLCDLAIEHGDLEDMIYARDLFSARLMGILTPAPHEVRTDFRAAYAKSPEAATDYFYDLCRKCDYIKVDAIAQNIRYFHETHVGNLEITINLSKPEKDPREIAKLKNAPSVGYPRCMLCIENPGYHGRSNFPARQNHRIVPLTLGGRSWYLQYSPYAYYSEHCIVFNHDHIPMKIDHGTFVRLFDFVSQFPHYFLGSNADLPIVGGSILNHDHFQGGRHVFPMDHSGKRILLKGRDGLDVSILEWPMSTLCLESRDQDILTEEADRILSAWRTYSDPDCDIYAQTEGQMHNTITPILRKVGDLWRLNLVLRNNRTSQEHPLGIFHPHAPLHHIKRENIGLIEVMGLFILPGRLKSELAELEGYLTGEKPLVEPDADDPAQKHFAWVREMVEKDGLSATRDEARERLRRETALVCAMVLEDSGVFKQDEHGLEGFVRFAQSLGYQKA